MKALEVSAALIIVLLVLAGLAGPAWAGGWATITLDRWPNPPITGEPFTVGFTVRQHGRDDGRLNGLSPTVNFLHPESGERLAVAALGDGQDGHYTAEVRLPAAGKWNWSIQAFAMDQPMPALTALAAEAAKPASLPAGLPPSLGALIVAGGVGLLAAMALAGRKRFRLAALAAAVGLALGAFGLTSAAGRASVSPVTAAAAPELAEMGENLFVAKGCIQCHANSRIEPELRPFTTEIGPNLSNYRASPEFMHLWLKNPKAAKPETQMPNLELTSAEIDALIAFITAQ